jgi:putative ABC transport system permease protein
MTLRQLFSFLRRDRRDAELDEEIRGHLALAEADRIRRGESPNEAADAARREFGNVGLVKEVTREMWGAIWFERLIQDLRYALRSLRLAPGFATIAILTLGLGIGATTAMFTVVNGVLLRPLPFAQPDRLFLISYKDANNPWQRQPALMDSHYLEYKARTRAFEGVAAFYGSPVTLTQAGEPMRLASTMVTPEFTNLLGVAPAIGTTFSADDGKTGREPVTLLSDNLWRDRFAADPRVVGKTITLDGVAHTVIGVMPPGFDFPNHARLWRPVAITLNPHQQRMSPVFGRLRPGVTVEQARAELVAVAPTFPVPPEDKGKARVAEVVPISQFVVGDVTRPLWVFAGAVGFVLLIACANVANLLLMRATSRQQEIALRSALGAERLRLIRQLLTESVVIAALGGALGVLLAMLGVRALIALAPAGRIPRVDELHTDLTVLAFTVVLSLVTGMVFGLAPAFRTTRRELRDSLGQGARTTIGHGGLRAAFVISEIALALMLLAGAGLMIRSFAQMRAVELGFRPENVVSMTVDLPASTYQNAEAMRRFHHDVLEGLARLPGVEAAGAVNWQPLGGNLIAGDFHMEDGRQKPDGWADKMVVSPDYFRTWGVRLRSGRVFTDRDVMSSPGVAIISKSVARRYWPNADPIGKRITTSDKPKPEDWLTIVGVVDDVIQEDVKTKRDPAMYQPYAQVNYPFFLEHMSFAVRTAASPVSIAPGMRSVLRTVDKDQPVQRLATMRELVSDTTAEPLFQARLLAFFSALALALAAVGIYGVLAYSVAERRHEIGIRVALGAQGRDIVRMVVRRTLALSVPGVVLGLLGALAVTRVIGRLLFGVKPNDPVTLIAVAGLLAAVALIAALIPARRATRVDPLTALRTE